MEERPEERLAEELQAIMDTFPFADAAPEAGEEPAAESGGEHAEAEEAATEAGFEEIDEDTIRARLRQVRQDTAHIPVAEEPEPGLIGKIKSLLGR